MSASFTITRKDGSTHVVLADADDLERVLAAGPWHVATRHRTVYVARNVRVDGKQTKQYLHRFLMEPCGMEVDHVNGDGLDNRRVNLRRSTHAQNLRNTVKRADNTSGLKGVCFHKQCRKWKAQIRLNGKNRHLGLFATSEAAHQAYCTAAAELHGEFARFA